MRLRTSPHFVSATVLAVAGVFSFLSLAAVSRATAPSTNTPRCHESKIQETVQPRRLAKDAVESYAAWISFTNVGALCSMPLGYLSVEALSGSTVLARFSIPGGLISASNDLRTGQSRRAKIGVDRTDYPALGKSCKPKAANTIEVLPVYNGWPKKSFHLSPTVLVCTGSSSNFGGNWLFVTP